MRKIIFVLLAVSFSFVSAQPEFTKIAGMPGAFSRLGFGARGIGMGNALSAVIDGNLVAYYNPALSAFQNGNSFQTSYSFLSLDRSLNFLSFTRKFDFGQSKDDPSKPRSTAGISVGIINSGVSGIEERDNQGIKTGDLSTSENQFFISVSNRFSSKLAIGFTAKFYYYKLYEDISSTNFGFDLGAVYIINDNLTVGAAITDINTKYKWDTSDLYGQQGNITENKFPLVKRIGISYRFIEQKILAALEFENSNAGTNIIRFGAEYNIYENLYLRTGLNNLNLSNFDMPVKPSVGFSYSYLTDGISFGVDYAFVIEPYSPSDQHIIGVNVVF